MKYSNVFVIAVLVSVFAAGFVCIADDAEAAPSNSGEAFVEDINTLLKGSVGEDIASATYTEGVVEILVDPSYTSLVALVDTAELKANAYQTFITYETFYLDGVYYVSSYIPDVDNGVNAALRIVGEMQDKLCSAQPGTITVFESSDFSVNKDGYDAFSGSLVVKVVADQDDIDFAKFASEYVQVDSESGQIYFTICFYGIDRNQSMDNIVDTVATMTADEFFLGNVNSGKVNTLCEQLIKYPGAVNSVAFIWENDGEIYSVAVDGFQPGEGKDAFQKLVAGISNSKAILPGLKDGWNEPVKTFQEPITGKYFVDDGAAVANYHVGNGTVVVLKALFDATVTPGYRNSGMAFVDDMNRFFEESGLDKVASGVYTDECLKFNFDYSAIYDRTVDININQTVEAMAKEILTSYDLFSINGVDYVVDGKPVTSAAHQLMYIVAGMADTVRKATPGDTELFLSDSFSVKKNLWDQYDGAISLSTTLDQFAIDAANYVSQFISVDPETLTISVRGYIYGLSEDYNASDLAFIYSHVNAKQLFEQKYVDYINWGCDMLMDEGAQFAPYFSIVWNINGVDYKLSLNEFTPGEGKDAFQKLAAGIYDSINSAPAGYSNGWEVPVKDFYVSPAHYVADGLGVMSVPGYPEFAVPVHGELALLDRPFDITILAPEHAVIIIVPHIDPIRVPVVVIPEPGYEVEDVFVEIDGVEHNITEDGYFELTGDAVVRADVQQIPPEPVHVTSVILNKESIDLVVGKTAFLQATVLPANATDKAVTWSSSNPAVASVDANGKVTAKSVGTAIITVTTVDGGFTDSCTVNVLEYIPVESMTLNITSATIDVGEYVVLIPKFLPQGASDTVVWTSSNTNVATVSYGVVWGVSPGHVVITATTVKEGISATCDIYVVGGDVPVTGVNLSAETATVDVGKSISLFATVLPANATNKAVTWSTSDASVATVYNGVVTGVAVGNATITVTTVDGGFTASCQVTVVYTPVTGVTLDKSKIDMKVGEVASVVATVAPANATNKAVT
ncbi:MAG: Ig domain-containing protein, partial [Candidatus Methanomethylophilaceae archaeon]|nr:Ig domain-containing protein [Candidatus Methanomethylophilaceae archaeon]